MLGGARPSFILHLMARGLALNIRKEDVGIWALACATKPFRRMSGVRSGNRGVDDEPVALARRLHPAGVRSGNRGVDDEPVALARRLHPAGLHREPEVREPPWRIVGCRV